MSGEQRLSDVLGEFARTMVTDFPIQSILDRLVESIVDVLPISSAGVTLISPGVMPRYVAASDGSALCFEELQTELGEGPCLAAYHGGEPVSVPDLRSEPRSPISFPALWRPDWRRCSPSPSAMAKASSARSTCTGTHRGPCPPKP